MCPRYADAAASTKIRGSSHKKDLAPGESVFSVMFQYGSSGDGYWTYDHMVIQLEDCVDVLDALLSIPASGVEQHHDAFVESLTCPRRLKRKFKYIFLTDHSCGHDRKRPDGLDVTSLRKAPSASAKVMRDVVITNKNGVLSEDFDHPLKLKVEMVQTLVFREQDNYGGPETGPFWWS